MIEDYKGELKTSDQFFSSWDSQNLAKIAKNRREEIYYEYKTKHTVFNRDNFECQVEECTYKESPLTIHHFRHRSNGGKTCPRNCITVCRAHQNKYHSGKAPLKFKKRETLPGHINGKTQAHDWYVRGKPKREKMEGFREKHRVRLIRKEHREHWGRPLSWEYILIIMTWLFAGE